MATIVLVHGAWHGAWCWYKLAPLLGRYGHQVLAPDLPGHGLDRSPVASVSLADYVERVGACLEDAGEPVVLVGHSLGGIVISQAAEQLPGQVRRLVYVAAFLPAHGDSLISLAAADADSLVTASSVLTADQTAVTLRTENLRELFYADCPEEDWELATSLLGAEPLAPLATPVSTTANRFGRIPRDYVATLGDRAVVPALQRQMYTAMPCERVIPMETGHSPFLADPDRLAACLDEFARLP